MGARMLDNYVGTSQRYSQRVLVSVAVQNAWDICTTDITKAFLQGVTYKELAEATGEPLREVNFVLPQYCITLLRQILGYEDFNPATEVLHCEKPGTGCNDAPRCFSLKLAQVTRNLCGLRPSTVDGELCMKHVAEAGRSKLVVIMTKHVDDLKLAGTKAEVTIVLQQIEKSIRQAED